MPPYILTYHSFEKIPLSYSDVLPNRIETFVTSPSTNWEWLDVDRGCVGRAGIGGVITSLSLAGR